MVIQPLSTYLLVKDVDLSLSFYGLLGLTTEKVSDAFGRVTIDNKVILELGTGELTSSYDTRYQAPPLDMSKGTINFELESSVAVEEKYGELVASGYKGYLEPMDALWQARFAIVLDPDGNQVGLHSPRSVREDRQRERGGA